MVGVGLVKMQVLKSSSDKEGHQTRRSGVSDNNSAQDPELMVAGPWMKTSCDLYCLSLALVSF